jgi:hypothetical protein
MVPDTLATTSSARHPSMVSDTLRLSPAVPDTLRWCQTLCGYHQQCQIPFDGVRHFATAVPDTLRWCQTLCDYSARHFAAITSGVRHFAATTSGARHLSLADEPAGSGRLTSHVPSAKSRYSVVSQRNSGSESHPAVHTVYGTHSAGLFTASKPPGNHSSLL